jgi:hypothetical protein
VLWQERKGGRAGGTQEIGREAGEVLNLLVLEAADAPLGGQVRKGGGEEKEGGRGRGGGRGCGGKGPRERKGRRKRSRKGGRAPDEQVPDKQEKVKPLLLTPSFPQPPLPPSTRTGGLGEHFLPAPLPHFDGCGQVSKEGKREGGKEGRREGGREGGDEGGWS